MTKEIPDSFPSKPKGKAGWPWDPAPGQSINTPKTTLGMPWPKISVITPSFNQGQFIEETIRSVLLQGYPNLEYIVIDGGSTDESVDIIRRYQDRINYWESIADRGQAHALNKGFDRCTGELVGWINSDDLLLPGTLQKLALAHVANPVAILLGSVIHFYGAQESTRLWRQRKVTFRNMVALQKGMVWQQPGTYVPGKFVHSVGLLDESLRYVFDRDWMCMLLQKYSIAYLQEPVAMFRLHAHSKTVGEKYSWLPEQELVTRRYWDCIPGIKKPLILARFELEKAAIALGARQWNRSKGINHLRNALAIYRPILFSPLFTALCIRCLFPYSFLMRVRSWLAKSNPYYRN
jgi:glycosyltransferase involved in cell wall biosynthesis